MPDKIAAKIDSIPELHSINIEGDIELVAGDILTVVVNGVDRLEDLVIPQGLKTNLHIELKGSLVSDK